MRKIPNFLLILALAVSSLLTFSSSSAADLTQGEPPPSAPTTNTIYLPLVIKVPMSGCIMIKIAEAPKITKKGTKP